MHKVAMEMGKWAMEKAKAHGFDNLTSQDWDDLKDCLETVSTAICADKDYRIVEAMDEAEQEDKFMGRMGYRGRDPKTGRFVRRSGRGRSAGYMPYIHMMDDEDYFAYDDIPYPMMNYRMGYTDDRGRGMAEPDGRSGTYGREMHQPSRYGETYGRYKDSRKHYTESSDPESKKRMDESTQEYVEEFAENLREMYKTADAPVKQKLKADLTKMIQQLQ